MACLVCFQWNASPASLGSRSGMAISGTSNYEIEVPCLVAKGFFGCGFSRVFKYLARNTQIFRHLLDPHLVLEQLRTKPSLFGIRGYKGSHGLNMAWQHPKFCIDPSQGCWCCAAEGAQNSSFIVTRGVGTNKPMKADSEHPHGRLCTC